MGTATNILEQVQLLVTDLDGTLLGRHPEFKLFNEFRDVLQTRRSRGDFTWAISTGRGLRNFHAMFLPLNAFGIMPDFVIVRHAFTFERQPWGYAPHVLWNLRLMGMLWKHRAQVHWIVPRLRHIVGRRIPFVRIQYQSKERICFRFEDAATTQFGADLIQEAILPCRYLRMFQYRTEVDVRMVPFTKGLSLTELAKTINIPPSRILAIGDGLNDISMMASEVVGYCACPHNAVPQVMETVHARGGHIAHEDSLAGVVEILNAYSGGSVCSDYPENWIAPAQGDNPLPPRRKRSPAERSVWPVLIGLLALYTVLLACIRFNVLRGADWLFKPYLLLIEWIRRLFGLG